ncbi:MULTISPECIES: hypothetical protein [Chryseobacterium]|jgi:hypothetical protein|uniref:Uncharacterized protein n=1 Tax=Chryseobacterium taihuense TaxID=1141221 RepID=A0A4U8WLJ6_9FLAO|nr:MULTISPECIES: hypothetical protein [Chryseobacterium]AZA56521.1 hypothetical protein EG350_04730 [Chryseobacterium shandongense]QQV03023.1 hypothetical protein I6I61_01280 [Chryseobacterium sp. FDAARGOS 1104]VFB03688.1 Uncharacterised protein [Chryseobacterium taihuense]
MFLKRFAILFLSLAQLIILGHGFVAHHHHFEENTHKHSHTSSDGENHHEESSLEFLFSNFTHSGEHITFTHVENNQVVVVADNLNAIKAEVFKFSSPVEYILTFQKHTFPPDWNFIYELPYFASVKHRGPPSSSLYSFLS